MKSIVLVYSYHHMNTERIAKVFAEVLGAEVKCPQDISPEQLDEYDLIGFGSGIDSAKHYAPMREFASMLPDRKGAKAFLFSTNAISGDKKMARDHSALRAILLSKGYVIVDEFACRGFNTNSFLKYIGGINRGRPNDDDLNAAALFAENVKQKSFNAEPSKNGAI